VGRLVEIQRADETPVEVRLQVGDVLSIGGTGAQVKNGENAIALLGAFLPASCTRDGDVVAPMGPPSIVLLSAKAAGTATLEIMSGDPFSSPVRKTLRVIVA
jgi:hypothetical protein